jgi:two-component system cell cycle response regulator DivK
VSKHIVVVENDAMALELTRRLLSSGGYDVTCVSDGEEALRVVPRVKPDLVLMDVSLPGIDGIEATEKLRAARATAAVPVVVLSAQAFGDNVERARRAGCVDYLTKPIGARELLERVGALVGKNGNARSSKRERNRR